MAKWIIGIVVIIIAAAALWWSGWLGNSHMAPATPAQTATTTAQQQAQNQQSAVEQQNGMSANNDASDAAITQDTAAIDAQMQGLSQDNSNVNSSLNDQPVTQSY